MVVTGSYGNATVTSQSTASTYVTGLNTSAVVKLGGTGSVYLNATSGAPAGVTGKCVHADALLHPRCTGHSPDIAR